MSDQDIPDEREQLRRRAVGRLIVALALIAAAIAGLAVVDRVVDVQQVESPAPSRRPSGMVAPPVQPFEVSVTATTPAGPPPPPSIAADAPAQGGRAPGRLAPGVPESTVGIVPQDTVAAPPSRPRPASPEAAAPASAAMPAAAVPEAVLVQLGVFGTPANADVLRHKVLRNGIVARTETRLQIGPFNDKAEAEAVLAKLKSIGVEAVLVPQP